MPSVDPREAAPEAPVLVTPALPSVDLEFQPVQSPQPGPSSCPMMLSRAQLPFLTGTGPLPHTSHSLRRLSCLPELEMGPGRGSDFPGHTASKTQGQAWTRNQHSGKPGGVPV